MELLDTRGLPRPLSMLFEQLTEGEKITKGLDWKVDIDRLEAMWVLNMTGMGLHFFQESQKTHHSQMDPDKIGSVMKHSLDRGGGLPLSSCNWETAEQ